MKQKLVISLLVAAVLWFVMFSPWTAPLVNFWWMMTASALILTLLAFLFGGRPQLHFDAKEILLGIGIAVVLWGVFWVGDKVSQLLFSFARPQVDLIYGMKEGQNGLLISLALLFIIGPAEELFWRGFVQRNLRKGLSANSAWLLGTFFYTIVHLPSANFMLIMAALVCGLIWGGLYRYMSQHFGAIVLSHALWDAAAFVWFPF